MGTMTDQTVSLVRALVRGCKVLILDKATSSVDPETDALIQRIIQTEFSDVTVSSNGKLGMGECVRLTDSCCLSHIGSRLWHTMTGSWLWTQDELPR